MPGNASLWWDDVLLAPPGGTMADSPDVIRAWPSSPDALADVHKCPGCFTLISDPLCPVCGFVVTDARAMRVLELGMGILVSEAERQRIIEEVRDDYRVSRASEPEHAHSVDAE